MLTYSPNSGRPFNWCGPAPQMPLCSSAPVEILGANGRVIPWSIRNSFIQYQSEENICNYDLGYQCDGTAIWLDGNTITALQSDAIWMDVNSSIKPLAFVTLDELNCRRQALSEQLDAIEPIVIYEGSVDAATIFSGPEGEWTYRLEDAISVIFPYPASGALATVDYVYRSGELVYQSCLEYASWLFQQARSLAQQLRHIGSLIGTWFRSRRGLSYTVGLFLNERSWYLHHSAHPPAVLIKAEGRFAATTRRACFRPLPA